MHKAGVGEQLQQQPDARCVRRRLHQQRPAIDPRQLPHETDQRLAFFPDVPIDPADLVILAIGVVVAVLRAGELVAGEQQRRAP